MVVAGDETNKRFHIDCPYFKGSDFLSLFTSAKASSISSSMFFLLLSLIATRPVLTSLFACENTASDLPASLASLAIKSRN